LFAVFLLGCGSNPYDPEHIKGPGEVSVFYDVTKVSDSLAAYSFFPVTFRLGITDGDLRYIDSVFLRSSGEKPFQKFDSTFTLVFSYADTGRHNVCVRYYFVKDNGRYWDTTFVLRTGINYGVSFIDVRVSDEGTVVPLRARGIKYEGIKWRWDLQRIEKGEIVSDGDTSIIVKKAISDTVFLSQMDVFGVFSPSVAVPFRSLMFGDTVPKPK
jgi:hypothetical protein